MDPTQPSARRSPSPDIEDMFSTVFIGQEHTEAEQSASEATKSEQWELLSEPDQIISEEPSHDLFADTAAATTESAAGSTLGSLGSFLHRYGPARQSAQSDLCFDDADAEFVESGSGSDDTSSPEAFDYEVPFGPWTAEEYEFEVNYPRLAPLIRARFGLAALHNLDRATMGLVQHGRTLAQQAVPAYNTVRTSVERATGLWQEAMSEISRVGGIVAGEAQRTAEAWSGAIQMQVHGGGNTLANLEDALRDMMDALPPLERQVALARRGRRR